MVRHRNIAMTSTLNTKTRFVYHRVPVNLIGSVLYPLNQLKQVYPGVAAFQFKKYQGREAVLSVRIPRLNCLWNDVLHFSPVHPTKIKAAMEETGHTTGSRRWRYFEVDAAFLSPSNTVIWEYREHHHPHLLIDESECLPFQPHLLDKFTEVGDWTRRYYAEVKPGARVLPYVGISHVLCKSHLKVEGVKIIEL
jgi:hypothetical protein